ncbi:MAG: hypothetical protein LBI54_01355 [Lachnospiraceae bacterium]|jgi:hypothetical protein|nr:hypothetical protein [Lachnospiraceae bacterium]
MHDITPKTKCEIAYDFGGRPTVSVTLGDKCSDGSTSLKGLENVLLDSGAVVTALNKAFADKNGYPVIKAKELVLTGFNDFGRAMKALMAQGMSASDINTYFKSFEGRGKELVESLENEYGITDIGIMFDLRKVSSLEFCGYIVKDVIVATPSESDFLITDVIGMNILEKFRIALDFEYDKLTLCKTEKTKTLVREDLRCGDAIRVM